MEHDDTLGPSGTSGRVGFALLSVLHSRSFRVAATLILLFVLWELLCRVFAVPDFLIPKPSEVFIKLAQLAPTFFVHSQVTLIETVAGFALAVVVGIVIAGVIVAIPPLRDIAMPLLLIAQLVPKVAIAPILLIWFGYGLLPKVLIAFLIAFFPIVVNVVAGIMTVERDLLNLGRSLRASKWQFFWKFQLPHALPYLFSGMKIAMTMAVIGAIIGEFVGSDTGLGYLIIIANQQLDTPLAFGALLILSAIGIVLYALVALAERVLLPWEAAARASKEGL